MKKIAILGASRGLGKEIYQTLSQNKEHQFLLAARKEEFLKKTDQTQVLSSDFSNKDEQLKVLSKLQEFSPTHIIYVAGGGPYGNFEEKKWGSHLWAFELNFLFPAQIIHQYPYFQSVKKWETLA